MCLAYFENVISHNALRYISLVYIPVQRELHVLFMCYSKNLRVNDFPTHTEMKSETQAKYEYFHHITTLYYQYQNVN